MAKSVRDTPRSRGEGSTELLLETAERLFAERSIDAVSLREIGREAGQRNTSALLYHFGSKEALVVAILRRRVAEHDADRNALLDRLEAEGRGSELRALAEAIVMPLASHLLSGEANTYVRFLASAQMSPAIDLAETTQEEGRRGFDRIYKGLRERLPELPDVVLRQRFLAGVSFTMFSLADYERIRERRAGAEGFDIVRAVENLIDMLTAAFAAPVSEKVNERLSPPRSGSGR